MTASTDLSATPVHPTGDGAARPAAIDLRGVRLTYGEGEHAHHAIDGVDLRVEEGEFVSLIGRSGCGKTSILNVVTGMVTPQEGSVSVLGGKPSASRSRFAYMLARDALMPWRTAQRNVQLPLEVQGRVPRAQARERAMDRLRDVGLEAAARKFPWQLSQGMRQRVALARTWANEPELLLVDEPFSALDAQTSEDVRQEFLRKWEAQRTSVLFITHDLAESILLSDRILLMRDGRIEVETVVPFERPRDTDEIRRTTEFQELEHELLQHLK